MLSVSRLIFILVGHPIDTNAQFSGLAYTYTHTHRGRWTIKISGEFSIHVLGEDMRADKITQGWHKESEK